MLLSFELKTKLYISNQIVSCIFFKYGVLNQTNTLRPVNTFQLFSLFLEYTSYDKLGKMLVVPIEKYHY